MRCWIAVAAAEHVRFCRSAGFMQVSHGAAAPLRRIGPGDCVATYSPTARFGSRERLQAFTAIGIVKPGVPYQVDMGDGFHPWRRDIRWLNSDEAPIRPLLQRLSFARAIANWGYRLRLGLLEVGESDMAVIAAAMGAALPPKPPVDAAVGVRSPANTARVRVRGPHEAHAPRDAMATAETAR